MLLTIVKKAGVALALISVAIPIELIAQDITVLRRNTNNSVEVSVNRSIVIESDIAFADLNIANPSIADFTSLTNRSIYIWGRETGITTLTLFDELGRLISNVDVRVTSDISELRQRLSEILPDERIEVRVANGRVILSGVVSGQQAADQAYEIAGLYVGSDNVSNLLEVGGQKQVLLKVRFAEVSRSISKALGGGLALSSGGTSFGGGNASTGNAAGSLNLSFSLGSVEASVLLQALENKGLVRSLAEPNLIALSGETAKFRAGSEIPIPQINVETNNATVTYKEIGVSLEFTPRVVENDLIQIRMKSEVSSLDSSKSITFNGATIIGTSDRKAETTVELRDGESFAVAGILEDNFRDAAGQLPVLGDIPILGALFRSANYQRDQTELVIIITPYLVSPTRGDTLQLPTDRVALPTEYELFGKGKVVGGVKSPAAEVAQQDFSEDFGYVVE